MGIVLDSRGRGEGVVDDDVATDVADAVVWLDDDQARDVLRLLIARDVVGATRVLAAVVPELGAVELVEACRGPLIEALGLRLEGERRTGWRS